MGADQASDPGGESSGVKAVLDVMIGQWCRVELRLSAGLRDVPRSDRKARLEGIAHGHARGRRTGGMYTGHSFNETKSATLRRRRNDLGLRLPDGLKVGKEELLMLMQI